MPSIHAHLVASPSIQARKQKLVNSCGEAIAEVAKAIYLMVKNEPISSHRGYIRRMYHKNNNSNHFLFLLVVNETDHSVLKVFMPLYSF